MLATAIGRVVRAVRLIIWIVCIVVVGVIKALRKLVLLSVDLACPNIRLSIEVGAVIHIRSTHLRARIVVRSSGQR